jgi:hypothetical protein
MRELRPGLARYWATEIKIDDKPINARMEDIADKPTLRDAFKRRRCRDERAAPSVVLREMTVRIRHRRLGERCWA